MFFRFTCAILATFLAVLTTSCANLVQDSHIAIQYKPPKLSAGLRAPSQEKIEVGVINDFRGVPDEKLLMRKAFGNGMQGKYLATSTISRVVEQAARASLVAQGYRLEQQDPHYVLTGNLLAMDLHWRDGVTGSTLQGKTTINFILTNAQTGQPVWRQTFSADLGHNTYEGIGESSAIEHVVERGLQDIMHQLESSDSFRNALLAK